MGIRKYEFNKLIRDKIPARMVEEGVEVKSRVLDEQDFAEQLKVKLLEETGEVLVSTTRQSLLEELADVTEVIIALAHSNGITMKEIEAARQKKLEINGSFTKECFIDYIEVDEANEPVINYLADKDRPYKLEKS